MQTAEAPFFKEFHVQTGFFAEAVDIFFAVDPHISVADQVYEGHLNMVAEPSYGG